MINELAKWRGRIRVISTFADGTQQIDEFDNLITDAGRNFLRDVLSGTIPDGEIKHIALGSDSTEPTVADTALGNERFRKQITKQTPLGTGQLLTTAYISSAEANNFAIAELGWFAGPDSTDEPGTGVLLARVLYSKQKSQLESLQIDRIDTIV